MDAPHIRICQHCSIPYDWRRSPSSWLKMTYCGSLCERADLGFTIETQHSGRTLGLVPVDGCLSRRLTLPFRK